jgi:zinc protease
VSVGRDHLTLSGDTLSASLEDYLGLMRDVLLRPRFEDGELERLKRQTLAELEELRDSDEELAQHLFNQVLLAPDIGARPLKGTPESLARITTAHVCDMASQLIHGDGLVVGAAGDVDLARLEAGLGRAALPLAAGKAPRAAPWSRATWEGIHIWLVDKPERTQTQIFAGHEAPTLGHPDWAALAVANTIFGGTFTSRLSHEIREKRGWSYGAYSSYSATPEAGSFFFRYYPAAKDAVAAFALGLELLQTFVSEGPTDAEVAFARAFLANQSPFRAETPHKQLGEQMQCALFKLPPDAVDLQLSAMLAVTRDEIHAAVTRWLRPNGLVATLVCTASELEDAIRAVPGVVRVTVVPYTTSELGPIAVGG